MTRQDVQWWDDISLTLKRIAKKRGKHGVRRGTQRHSLPLPVVMEKRDKFVPRSKSFLFKQQKNTRGEVESTPPGGRSGGLVSFEDPDVSSLGGDDRRHSAQSVASSGIGGITGSLEPRSRWNSWRFSLSSNVSSLSSSSALTRSSGSTASTSLTALSPGTISKRSSRGSILQKERRFSSVRCELDAILCQVQVLNPGFTSGRWGTFGVG